VLQSINERVESVELSVEGHCDFVTQEENLGYFWVTMICAEEIYCLGVGTESIFSFRHLVI
jgi:hypothetical protein